jgi:type I restriction enzyme R subunit
MLFSLPDFLPPLNGYPPAAIEDAIKKLVRAESPNLYENNRQFHKFLTDGVNVSSTKDGAIKHEPVWLFDFQNPDNNDWLALNQFTVIEGKHNRRPDVVIFLNGIPIDERDLLHPPQPSTKIRHGMISYLPLTHESLAKPE